MSQFVCARCKAKTTNQFKQEIQCNLPAPHVGEHVAITSNASRWQWKNEDEPKKDPHWKVESGVATYEQP